ncbi:MAG: hypothetical protein AXA67_06110 [Methylothermaceae bacteria B42]|nr:MAG: hypothetical protein AXA67_06110 [Methylothermaceae bacteria B42]
MGSLLSLRRYDKVHRKKLKLARVGVDGQIQPFGDWFFFRKTLNQTVFPRFGDYAKRFNFFSLNLNKNRKFELLLVIYRLLNKAEGYGGLRKEMRW